MKTKKQTPVQETQSTESVISLILGIAVVAVIGILLFNYFKNLTKKTGNNTQTLSEETNNENGNSVEIKEGEFKSPSELPTKYKVAKGDNLWKISEKFFGTGYNFVDIKKENNILDANVLNEGQEITIPSVEPKIIGQKVEKTEVIEGNSYVVAKGDNLWKISVRAYQDGYQWTKIAKANNLVNPSVLFVGTTLSIPR